MDPGELGSRSSNLICLSQKTSQRLAVLALEGLEQFTCFPSMRTNFCWEETYVLRLEVFSRYFYLAIGIKGNLRLYETCIIWNKRVNRYCTTGTSCRVYNLGRRSSSRNEIQYRLASGPKISILFSEILSRTITPFKGYIHLFIYIYSKTSK